MDNLQAALETYLIDMHRRHATGATRAEASYYGPLEDLLNTIGASLKPKVLCVGQLGNVGGGQPEFGLFTAKQSQHGQPREDAVPERGVIEVKSLHEEWGRSWMPTTALSSPTRSTGRRSFRANHRRWSFLVVSEPY